MPYRLFFHPSAERELEDIYDYIADQSGPIRAESFVSSIRDHCKQLVEFPERGTLRDDLRPGLRVIGFRRRVSIAFAVKGDRVTIIGIFYGGRDMTADIFSLRS